MSLSMSLCVYVSSFRTFVHLLICLQCDLVERWNEKSRNSTHIYIIHRPTIADNWNKNRMRERKEDRIEHEILKLWAYMNVCVCFMYTWSLFWIDETSSMRLKINTFRFIDRPNLFCAFIIAHSHARRTQHLQQLWFLEWNFFQSKRTQNGAFFPFC